MNETTICAIVPSIIALIGTMFTGVVAYLMLRLRMHAERSSKENLDHLQALTVIAHSTHKIVNSASLVQLQLNAVMARRIAHLTGDSADVAAATLAEELYGRHKAQQQD
jgi:hypothetical protein